jgi:GLPGLI family protein
MKKMILYSGLFLGINTGYGQVSDARPDHAVGQGKIIYERIMQLQIRIADENPALQNMIPKERKDRYELSFADNKSLWQRLDDEQSDEMSFGGEGAQIRFVMPGSEDVVYHNLDDMKKTEQRELGGKTFIVSDSIRRMSWKITGETKMILGHPCMKATTQRLQESMRMNMDNGTMSRQRVTDTLHVVAWFTNEITGSYGPDIYQGQLPGTILEVDINNGRNVFRAVEIREKTDVAKIKEPAKGKKVTADEFAKEREKLFSDMQQNGGGGMRFNIRNN